MNKFKYSIPQRNRVTKQNALDLWHYIQAFQVRKNSKFCWYLINILINNGSGKGSIDDLPEISKQRSLKESSQKQYNTLSRCVFGKRYTVNTYLDLMDCLNNLDGIEHCDYNIIEQEKRDADPISAEAPTIPVLPIQDTVPDDLPDGQYFTDQEESQGLDAINLLMAMAKRLHKSGDEIAQSNFCNALQQVINTACRSDQDQDQDQAPTVSSAVQDLDEIPF